MEEGKALLGGGNIMNRLWRGVCACGGGEGGVCVLIKSLSKDYIEKGNGELIKALRMKGLLYCINEFGIYPETMI